jgi:TM2 domain-containing membrane protein YozV
MEFGDWLGSVWFALLLGVVGYVLGNLFPIGKIFKK